MYRIVCISTVSLMKMACCRFWLLEIFKKFLIFQFLLICQLNIANCNVNQQVHRRFEYKYSFKPPYLAQRDGTVPFWEYGGSKCVLQKQDTSEIV